MLNRVELIGHIGQTPEIRYTQDKKAIANLSVATSESYKDKDGNKQENTEWHRVVAFGKLAEIIGEYCGKGQLIYVAGKIRTRKWTDKEGQERYTTEIVANEMKMLSKKEGGAASHEDQPASQEEFDDSIPF
jgi:single stranded DNA-binding protein (ssb)